LNFFSNFFWIIFRVDFGLFSLGFCGVFGRLIQKELRLGVDGFGLGAYISPSRHSKTTRLVRETSGGLV
jgi:hypothetical protein